MADSARAPSAANGGLHPRKPTSLGVSMRAGPRAAAASGSQRFFSGRTPECDVRGPSECRCPKCLLWLSRIHQTLSARFQDPNPEHGQKASLRIGSPTEAIKTSRVYKSKAKIPRNSNQASSRILESLQWIVCGFSRLQAEWSAWKEMYTADLNRCKDILLFDGHSSIATNIAASFQKWNLENRIQTLES